MRVRVLAIAVVLFSTRTTPCDAAPPESSQSIDLARLTPWTNPFSEHPLFKSVVQEWKVGVDQSGDEPSLTLETVLTRSTDYPFSLGADYSGVVRLDQLTMDVENSGQRQVKVGVLLVTDQGERITSPFQIATPGERSVLTFDMLDAKPQQRPDRPARLERIEIVLRSMHARLPYRVSLGTLEFHRRPSLKPVEIEPLEVAAGAGGEVRLAWPTSDGQPPEQPAPVNLTIERNESVFLKATTRMARTGEGVALEPVSIRLPKGMPGGEYEIFADTRRLPVIGQPPRRALVGRLRVSESPAGAPIRARVQQHNGAPAITLNGEPSNGLMYMTYALEEEFLGPFGSAGVELFSFDTSCGFHPYGLTSTTWPAPDKVDFTECDAHATRVLSACPEAKLLIRCYVACPPWWAEANPSDCMTGMTIEDETLDYEEKPGFRPGSWASRRWRRDMGEILRQFVRHLRGVAYSDRIIGLMICCGVTEEWMMFGSNTGGVLTDYSPAAQAAFREWVRRQYGTEEALQDAWWDPRATFWSLRPPTPKEVAAACRGDFLDLPDGRRVADWWRFLSDLTADTIEHYARIVKEESQGDWLCGAFYGYVVQFHEQRIVTAGHLAIDRMTRSPYLDYFFSPALYSHRSLEPGGYSTLMSLVDSYHVNGKLWCNENDLRTFRVLDVPNVKADQIDRRQTPEETIALLRRQLGCVLARGCGHSYFDMQGGWYDDPRLAAEIATEVAVADRALRMDRSSCSEIAVVIDPDAFTGQTPTTRLNTWLILGQIASLGSLGAPFDLITPRDMEALPRRKMWIFLNLFNPTPERIEAIHGRLRRDGATALFVYAPGYQAGPEAMRRLTGMRILAEHEPRPIDVTVPGDGSLVDEAVTYGSSSPIGPASYGQGVISPTFHVEGDQLEVLGVDAVSKRPALCVQEMDGWRSVYSAAPCVAPSVLRALAASAGAHIYVHEDAVVYANQSLVSVTVVDAGRRTIHLPSPMTVEDGFTGQTLARRATEVELEFEQRESKLLLLTP